MDWRNYNMNDDLFLDFHYSEIEISNLKDRLKETETDINKFSNMLKEDVKRMLGTLKWNDWNVYVRTRGFVLLEKLLGYE